MNNLMAPSAAAAPSANDSRSRNFDGTEMTKGIGQAPGGDSNSVTQSARPIDYSFLNASADGATGTEGGGPGGEGGGSVGGTGGVGGAAGDGVGGAGGGFAGGAVRARHYATGGTVAPAAGQAGQAGQAYYPITASVPDSSDTRMAASEVTDGYNLGPFREWALQVGKQVGAFKAEGGPISAKAAMSLSPEEEARRRREIYGDESPPQQVTQTQQQSGGNPSDYIGQWAYDVNNGGMAGLLGGPAMKALQKGDIMAALSPAVMIGKSIGLAEGGPVEANRQMAQHLAAQGRGRDTTLVHMSRPEVMGLGSLHPSGQMPINPKTGLPEADFLTDVLPGIAGTVIGSVVGMPWLGAAIGGLGTWAATGNLGKGILSGLMSFGLGSIGGELANAGAQAAGSASTTAAKAAAASGSLADPLAQGAAQVGGASTQAASDIVTKAGQGVAGANPTGFFDKVAQGFQNAPETFGNMGRGLMNPQNLNLSKMMMPGIMGATGAYGLYSANQQPPAAPQPMMPQQGQAPTLANAPPRVPTGYKPPPGYGTSAAPQEGTFFQPNPAWNGYPMYASTGGEMRTYQTPDGGRYELAKGGVANLPSGMIRGPGAGMDDKIKGTIDGRRDVYLSDGEYVVDAQTISALGDGSSEAGAKRMKQLVENIRQKKFGSKKQPPKMAQTGGLASLGIV